ncbi:hypothetical protein Tco_1202747 [Tanacetum coccineum]
MAIWLEDGLKNQDQGVEMASRKLVKSFETHSWAIEGERRDREERVRRRDKRDGDGGAVGVSLCKSLCDLEGVARLVGERVQFCMKDGHRV